MKTAKRFLLAALFLLGFKVNSFGAELIQTPDLTINLDGRFQELGELEIMTYEPLRDHTRVYLFNTEDRLMVNGDYKGIDFNFETALGGEAMSSSNNQINLLEYDANVPLDKGISIMAGQFKVPANLESADYDGNILFTEKSELMTVFFNTGYDTGIALSGRSGDADFILGVLDGAPDLPQRYLPEYFNFPPMTFLRLGITDGIKDDPWHPKQTGFEKPDSAQFEVHVNGIYLDDSNAGHSTDAALQSTYFTIPSATSYYGNALLTSAWNPFLGKTAANYGKVDAHYWQASLDTEYRAPLGDTTFTLQAQVNVAHFDASNFAPITMNGNVVTSGDLNIGGGEVQASVGDKPLELAGRFSMVVPDKGFANNYATGKYTPITPFGNIFELTFPSVTWHVNDNTKLIAEAMWLIATPIVFGGDGEYVITEMPSQVTNATNTNPMNFNDLVPVGRMMFQFSF